jgi:hypothetical protein
MKRTRPMWTQKGIAMTKSKTDLATTASAALPGQVEEDATLVETVALAVRQAYKEGGLATLLNVGNIVLEAMFGGSIDEFKTAEKSHASFRALAKHGDIGISASNLWYAVALHENVRLLGDDANKLASSQHRLLAHVSDQKQRAKFAHKAIAQGLTVRQLNELIQASNVRDPEKPKRGRPTLAPAVKRVRELQRLAEQLKEITPEALAGVEFDDIAELRATGAQLRSAVANWLEQFDLRLAGMVLAESPE